MTDIEVTPEVLWAVRRAAVLDVNLSDSIVNELGDWAERLERKQADEQRIDELARVFLHAEQNIAIYGLVDWANQSENQRDAYRAGIRAVLAEYDPEERLTAPRPYDQGGHTGKPLRQWGDLRDVPDDVLAVRTIEGELRRNGSESYDWRWTTGNSVSAYGLTAHAPYTEIPSVEEPNA